MNGVNIGAFLARRSMLDPDKVALIAGDQRLTFGDLNRRANRMARSLAKNGIGRGDRVAVLFRNSVEYYEVYFGLAKLGAILTGINWRLARTEVHFLLKDCGAKLFFYDDEFTETAAGLATELPDLKEEIVVRPAEKTAVRDYKTFASGVSDSPLEVEGGNDDPLVLMYTSGTTGLPKGALLTHNQLFWCSTTISHTLDHRQSDVNLLPLPMYHVGGISFVTTYVHLGATVVLIPNWDTEKALSLIEQEGINHFMAVPTMLDGILKHPNLERYNLSSLRWLLASAAPVPADLIKAFHERGIVVLQSYGLTETAGPATVTPKAMFLEKAGSAGLPFFHTEVRLAGETGGEVPSGEVGEIWIRGPHIFSGYWGNEAATRQAFTGDWFHSGDLAIRDEDGYLTIVDRQKDMIISGGENIYPAELERILYAHPKLAELAIIGLPDEKWGETVCAVVALKNGESLTLDELQDYCNGRIARYKMPRRLIIRETPLPRNPTGKLLKVNLRKEILETLE